MLDKERIVKAYKKDAILEAVCNWFPAKMLSYNLYEQIVIMNLCLEASAVIFYEYARPAIDPENESKYLQTHSEIDHEHEKMGLSLLGNLSTAQYQRLMDVQEEAWAMTEALFHRLAELTIAGS